MTTTPLAADSVPLFEPAPGWLRAAALVAGVVSIAAGGGALAFALLNSPAPLWIVAVMQALVVAGGAFAVAWSRGAFAAGPVLGLLCAAGTVGVGGFLSFVANRGGLGPLPMKAWSGVEALCAVMLAAAAFWAAVSRDPSSKKPAIRGVLLAIPAIAGAMGVVAGSQLGVDKVMAAMPSVVRLVLMMGYGLVASVMLCMAAHAISIAMERATTAGRKAAAE